MSPVEEQYDRGVEYKVAGQYEEAIAEFQAVLSADPEHAPAHRQLGLVYGFLGLFDESIQELLASVELNGHDLEARNDLALTYAMIGMTDEAKSQFEIVLAADPENAIAKRNMTYF